MATIFTGIMPAKVDGSSSPNRPTRSSAKKPGKPTRSVMRQVDAPPEDALPPDALSFERDADAVLLPLQAALRAVLDALPGRLDRSTDLQRVLQSDPKLAWQIYKFVHAPAVLPASSALPGAQAVQRFHKLAAKRGVEKPLIDNSLAAFKAFEQFVTDRAGDRRSFNTMAGGGRNDGQATNLAHKKNAFRAAAHFLGVQTDVIALTFLVHPSKTPGKWDLATLVYKIGIRRLRPDTRIMLAHVVKTGQNTQVKTGGRFEPIEPGVDPSFVATLLPPFCSNATADTVIKHEGDDFVEMEVAAGSVGTAGATDWAFGVVERQADVLPIPGENLKFSANISAAVQTLIVDVFVHETEPIEPSTKVQTYLLSTTSDTRGRQDYERMNLNESIVSMGRGDVAAQRSEIPRYNDLVRYATERLGWKTEQFKAYRCRVECPVLGSSLDLHFDYPDKG